MDIGKLLFTFDGRIGRQQFWIGWLILFAAGFVLNIALAFFPPLRFLVFLAMIYPKVCIYAKRLHDMGKTGWLVAIPYVVFVGCLTIGLGLFGAGIISMVMMGDRAADDPAAVMALLGSMGGFFALLSLSGVVSLIFWLWAGCTPSQPGPNRYGAGPEGTPDQDIF